MSITSARLLLRFKDEILGRFNGRAVMRAVSPDEEMVMTTVEAIMHPTAPPVPT